MDAPHSQGSYPALFGTQLLRRLERDEPHYYPEIDLQLANDAARSSDGSLSEPQQVLASRAGDVLQTRFGLNTRLVGDAVGWLKLLRFVGYVAAFLIGFSLCRPWLSEEQTLNVEWIFGFLLTLCVSMVLTSVLMITAAFSGKKTRDEQQKGGGGAATSTFAKFLVVHWLFTFVIKRALPWVRRRILKQKDSSDPAAEERAEQLTEASYDTLTRQSRQIALEAAATSNMLWLIAGLGIFAGLVRMGLFSEYDFRWQATIVSDDFMLESTQALARPIQSLPLAHMPTADDVQWLTTGEVSKASADEDVALRAHTIRKTWGQLFLAYLLYYGLLPRFLLVLISKWLAARGWRKLRPRLKSDYYREVLRQIEHPPFESEEDQDPDAEHAPPEEEAPPTADVSPPEPTPESIEEPPEFNGQRTAVFGFDVKEPNDGWLKCLPFPRGGQAIDLGNADDRASRKSILTELAEQRSDIGCLVLVTSLVDNPDGLFEDFVQKAVGSLHPQTARAMVLTNGEKLRQRFQGNADQVASRIELWRRKGRDSGMEAEKILEYDVENTTAEARKLFEQRFSAILNDATDRAALMNLRAAGQFPRAAALIAGRVGDETAALPEDQLQNKTRELHQEIRDLYAKQTAKLEAAFANVKIDTNRLRSAVAEKAGQAAGQLQHLEAFSRMANTVGAYTKRLSGKWAVASGMVCALGGGALSVAAAPALLPALLPAAAVSAKAGVLGGLMGAHIKHVAAKLGIGRKEAAGEQPTEVAESSFTLDDMVRSSTLLALILEFQGSPEEQIARTLEEVLSQAADEPLTTPGEVQEWLNQLSERVEGLVKKLPAT